MTLTLSEARDAVLSFVNAEWTTNVLTSSFPLLWDNVKGDKPGEDGATTRAEPWGRATVRIVESPQDTIGAQRRYTTDGIVTVQVFTPFGDGHLLGDQISEMLLSLWRGHVGSAGDFWFFDIVAQEIGVDGPWFQTNAVAGFRFQEVP